MKYDIICFIKVSSEMTHLSNMFSKEIQSALKCQNFTMFLMCDKKIVPVQNNLHGCDAVLSYTKVLQRDTSLTKSGVKPCSCLLFV